MARKRQRSEDGILLDVSHIPLVSRILAGGGCAGEWREIGKELGLSDGDIEDCEKNANSSETRLQKILTLWYNQTEHHYLDTLKESITTAAPTMKEKIEVISLPVFPAVKRSRLLSDTPVKVKLAGGEYIKVTGEVLSNLYRSIALSPSASCCGKYVPELVEVALEHVGSGSDAQNIEVVSYDEAFGAHKESDLVLLEGQPGSGLTTLVRSLVKGWASGKLLVGASFVFLLSLQILLVKKVKEMSEALKLFYNDEDQAKMVAKQLESREGEKACFILEGLNEYHEENETTNLLKLLISKAYLPKAMVIICSRFLRTDLQKGSNSYRILGLSGVQSLEYITKHCRSSNRMTGEFQAQFTTNKYYKPSYVSMICHIYNHYEQKIFSYDEASVYALYTYLLIKCKISNSHICESHNTITERLGQLAFEMVIQSVTISEPLKEASGEISTVALLCVDPLARLLGMDNLYSFPHTTLQQYLAASHIASQNEHDQLKILRDHLYKPAMAVVCKFLSDMNMGHEAADSLGKVYCAYASRQLVAGDSVFRGEAGIVLSFKNREFCSLDIRAIAHVLSHSSVTGLMLENCSLSQDVSVSAIEDLTAEALKDMKCMRCAGISADQIQLLNDLLRSFNSLEALDLSGLELNEITIETLSRGISLPHLKVLKIQMPIVASNDSTDVSLNCLTFKSNKLKQIRYSYIDGDQQSHKKSLMNIAASFPCEIIPPNDFPHHILSNLDIDLSRVPIFLNLTNLFLVNCNIDDVKLGHLKLNNDLETLRLDFNHIKDAGAELLASKLAQCSRLAHFSASCNSIDDVGAKAIAKALTRVNGLKELNLQCNAMGDQGAEAIARAVHPYSTTLSKLYLWNVNITDEGARRVIDIIPNVQIKDQSKVDFWNLIHLHPEVIGRAVSCCKYSHRINLGGKRLGEHCTVALADHLAQCTNLKHLNISNCRIGFKGMRALGTKLKNCKQLVSLNLAENNINSDFLKKIVRGLKECRCLAELNLSKNVVDEAIDFVASELGQCRLQTLRLDQSISNAGTVKLSNKLSTGTWTNPVELTSINTCEVGSGNVWASTLEILNLNNNELELECVASLAGGLKSCSSLKELSLCGNNICRNGGMKLAEGLKNCHNLQTLRLDHNMLNREGIAAIAKVLQFLTHLCHISVSHNNTETSGAVELIKELKNNCGNLQVLVLEENRINLGQPFSETFAEAMSCWTHLSELNFSKNKCKYLKSQSGGKVTTNIRILDLRNVGGGCLNILSTMRCTQLDTLILSKCGIDSQSVELVTAGLEEGFSLRKLDLSCNEVDTACCIALCYQLKVTKLEVLNLERNYLGSKGARVLAASAMDWTGLKYLNINSNDIGIQGTISLRKILMKSAYLEELYLENNGIGQIGATALGLWLSTGTERLRILDLSMNRIGSKGATEIAKGLEFSRNIQTLHLQKNDIGSDCSKELAAGLEFCGSIQVLRLDYNGIDDHSACLVATSLKKSTALQSFNLTNNPADNIDDLSRILPFCTITTKSKHTSHKFRRQAKKQTVPQIIQ